MTATMLRLGPTVDWLAKNGWPEPTDLVVENAQITSLVLQQNYGSVAGIWSLSLQLTDRWTLKAYRPDAGHLTFELGTQTERHPLETLSRFRWFLDRHDLPAWLREPVS